mgnify:CR=1 FL=1
MGFGDQDPGLPRIRVIACYGERKTTIMKQTPIAPLPASDLSGFERLAAFMVGVSWLSHWQRRRLQRQRAAKKVGRKVIYRQCDMSHCGVAHAYLGFCPCCDAGPKPNSTIGVDSAPYSRTRQ